MFSLVSPFDYDNIALIKLLGSILLKLKEMTELNRKKK